MKLEIRKLNTGGRLIFFYCPGCNEAHPYYVDQPPHPGGPMWHFNGDAERPSFTPSLMVNRGCKDQCHLYVTAGNIEYMADCHHVLANKTVPLQHIPEDLLH